jgi:hypothetical protein
MVKRLVILGLLLGSAVAQTTVAGGAILSGGSSATSSFSRNGSIYIVFPAATTSPDYTLLTAAGSVWDNSLVDGVTVQLSMNAISQINAGSTGAHQMYIPGTNPAVLGNCSGYTVDTDTCIKMTGAQVGNTFVTFAAPIYFPFSWSTIESTTSPGIQQWFGLTPGGKRKTVNLLDFSQSNGAINGSTSSYIGTSSYLALFNPGTQDFLNGVATTNTCTYGGDGGRTGLSASRSGSTTVTVTLANHGYTTGQLIWVNATAGSGTFAQYNAQAVAITVTSANAFTYTVGTSATDTATLTTITDNESFIVPYELPFLTARQAFLKAVHNHFNASYSNASGGTAAQLGYWRNGQSSGAETVPFCYTQLGALAAPYTLATDTATTPGTGNDCFVGGGCLTWGFVDYYKNDLLFGETLHSYMRLASSLNNGGAGGSANDGYSRTEDLAVPLRTNGSGLFDIAGEQGAALSDITAYFNNSAQTFSAINPPNMCGNDGCFMATTWTGSGMPLEIQPISISAYDDGNCGTQSHSGTGKCAVPSTGNGGDSGDMRQWLRLYTGLSATDGTNNVTLAGHATILEGYYRDLALALDPNFCTLNGGATTCTSAYSDLGNPYTWYSYSTGTAYQFHAFQSVGLGNGCGITYTAATLQTNSTGDCSYALALKNFHGQH